MVRDKIRIRFSKSGDLRMISHHDLMRCFERMLRRAAIPYHATQGFNPKPRLIFAMPLPLGIVGSNEIAELELDEEVSAEEVLNRLAAQAPDGLRLLDAHTISPKTAAHVFGARYRIPLPPEREAGLPERIAALLATTECMVERQRPRYRRRPRTRGTSARVEQPAIGPEPVCGENLKPHFSFVPQVLCLC